METREFKTRKQNNRFALGLLLIAAGCVLLAGKLGYLPYRVYDMIFSWPMILIAIGAFNFAKREYVAGTILLAVGSFFLLPDLLPQYSTRDIIRFWPVLLILGGLLFIFRKHSHGDFNVSKVDVNDHDVIDEINIFGGGVSNVESANFRGGKITCVFGGGEVSFAGSKLSENGAVIDVVAVFGGTKIMVPRDWGVKVEIVSIFGGFADKRIYLGDSAEGMNKKILLIKGVTIFGGGELRNI